MKASNLPSLSASTALTEAPVDECDLSRPEHRLLYIAHLVEHIAAHLEGLAKGYPEAAKALAIKVINTNFPSQQLPLSAEETTWCIKKIKEAASLED